MERLTERNCKSFNEYYIRCNEHCDKDICDCGCDKFAEIVRRMGTIEDILGDDYDLDRLRVIVNQRISLRDEVAERFKLTSKIPIDRLRELVQADRDERCIVPPAKIGDKVYHITTCKNFKKIYDGTLYGDDGGPGTATGLYCPCELAETCPFPCDEDGWFDCYDHKNEIEIFEDVVTEIVIGDTLDYVGFEYSGAAEFEEFGKTVFLTREAAEAALKAQKG